MVYVLFFYDMAMTMINIFFCGVFVYLFFQHKKALHVWLAVLFGLSSLDIILMYMLDFVPEFQLVFSGIVQALPFMYIYLHFLILFSFRIIAGLAFDKRPHRSEAVAWLGCFVFVTISGFFPTVEVRSLTQGICTAVIQFFIVVIGVTGVRGGCAEAGVLGRQRTVALIISFSVCAIGYLAYTLYAFSVGEMDPRNPFVEISGAVNVVFSTMYLVLYQRRRCEETAITAVPAISEAYGLTRREEEMLGMLIQEMSNQEIASQCFISIGTVKTHAHNIYSKLGISGRTQVLPFVHKEIAQNLQKAPQRKSKKGI